MTEEHPDTYNRPASIAVMVLLGGVSVFGFNIQPMYLGALADHLGYSPQQLGLIAGLEITGSALAGIAATFWVRRWPWRRVCFAALLALALGNAASIFVEDFATLIAVRFLTGFFGMGSSFALSIAALSGTRNTERNFSVTVVAQVSFGIAGFALLPRVIETVGTAGVFLPLAATAIALLPFLRLLPDGGTSERAASSHGARVSPFGIWLALGCQAAWYLGVGGVWAFVERMGAEAGIDAVSIGNALALGMALGLSGAFLAAAVADRWGRVLPFAVAMLGQVFAVWFLVDLEELSSLIIAICLYNSTWNFALPYIFSLAALADTRGGLVVLMSTAQALGLTFGATLAGSVAARYGLPAVAYQGAAAAMLGLLIYVALASMLRGVRHP